MLICCWLLVVAGWVLVVVGWWLGVSCQFFLVEFELFDIVGCWIVCGSDVLCVVC